MAHTASLVCLISTVSAVAKRKKKSKKCGASGGHTTKLEQSISLDVYELTYLSINIEFNKKNSMY